MASTGPFVQFTAVEIVRTMAINVTIYTVPVQMDVWPVGKVQNVMKVDKIIMCIELLSEICYIFH